MTLKHDERENLTIARQAAAQQKNAIHDHQEKPITTLKHDDKRAVNRYRCPDCRKRWAADEDSVPKGYQDACPACGKASWPLKHGLTARQRFAVYWAFVFVTGWGFGAAIGYAYAVEGMSWLSWWPLR